MVPVHDRGARVAAGELVHGDGILAMVHGIVHVLRIYDRLAVWAPGAWGLALINPGFRVLSASFPRLGA